MDEAEALALYQRLTRLGRLQRKRADATAAARARAARDLVRAVGSLGRAAELTGVTKARMQQLVKQAR